MIYENLWKPLQCTFCFANCDPQTHMYGRQSTESNSLQIRPPCTQRVHNLSKWVDLPLISSVDALRAAHLHRGLATSCLAGSCSSLGPWSVYSASLRHHVSAKTAETGETGPDVSLCRDRGSLAFSQFRFEHYLQSRFSLGRPWKGWVKIYNVNMLVG